ncbi:MAG TPA: thioesterase family protein [Alphaproteobacteria bacterium]|nr:thioesterase family protein [Alphaproteobacteria bacterium]
MGLTLHDYPVSTTFRVEYGDTDGQGRVFFANYFLFFDRGRFAYWERLGLSAEDIRRIEQNCVVVEAHCTYRAPAAFYDLVSVHTRVANLGRSSFRVEYVAVNDSTNTPMAEGYTVLVHVDVARNTSVPLPVELKARIQAFEGHRLND